MLRQGHPEASAWWLLCVHDCECHWMLNVGMMSYQRLSRCAARSCCRVGFPPSSPGGRAGAPGGSADSYQPACSNCLSSETRLAQLVAQAGPLSRLTDVARLCAHCVQCASRTRSLQQMPAGAKRRQLCIPPLLPMLTRIGRTNAQCSPSLSGSVVDSGGAESPAAVSLCTLGPIARRL